MPLFSSARPQDYKMGIGKLILRVLFSFSWELSLCVSQPGAIDLPIFPWAVLGDWQTREEKEADTECLQVGALFCLCLFLQW